MVDLGNDTFVYFRRQTRQLFTDMNAGLKIQTMVWCKDQTKGDVSRPYTGGWGLKTKLRVGSQDQTLQS